MNKTKHIIISIVRKYPGIDPISLLEHIDLEVYAYKIRTKTLREMLNKKELILDKANNLYEVWSVGK